MTNSVVYRTVPEAIIACKDAGYDPHSYATRDDFERDIPKYFYFADNTLTESSLLDSTYCGPAKSDIISKFEALLKEMEDFDNGEDPDVARSHSRLKEAKFWLDHSRS